MKSGVIVDRASKTRTEISCHKSRISQALPKTGHIPSVYCYECGLLSIDGGAEERVSSFSPQEAMDSAPLVYGTCLTRASSPEFRLTKEIYSQHFRCAGYAGFVLLFRAAVDLAFIYFFFGAATI